MDKGPFVRITTRLRSKLMAPVVFNGVMFTDTINFSQSYAYPILNPASSDEDTIDDDVVGDPDDTSTDDDGDDDNNDDREEEVND